MSNASHEGAARSLDIAMLDPSLFTPPYDSALCEALIDRGHRVRLIGRPPRPDDPPLSPRVILDPLMYRLAEALRARGLEGRGFVALKGVEHLAGSAYLLAHLRRQRPDAIHVQWFSLPLTDVVTARLMQRIAPVILTVHDTNLFHGSATSRVQLLGWRALLRGVDACIVHTAKSRARLVEVGVEDVRIFEVPHGLLTPTASTDGLPSRAPGDDTLRLLVFGHVQRYKGVDVLLRALAELPPAIRHKVRLVVAGNISFPQEELTDLARELGVDDCVDWRFGFVPDEAVASTFAETDVCVFPYRDIDASGALMLALDYGKAVLASRIGVFAETLREGSSALFAEPDDPHGLASQIARLQPDRALLRRLSEGATAVANAVVSWSRIAEMTEEVYRAAGATGRGR